MAIVSGDIKFYLSGGSGNTDPAASLGGAISTTEVTGSTLFDTVSGAESAAGDTNYRCIYAKNTHGTLTLNSAKVWLNSDSEGQITIALGGEGDNGTAETVANEATAPSGETFSESASEGASLSLGNLAAGHYYPIWLKRVVTAGASAANATFTVRVKGDTEA